MDLKLRNTELQINNHVYHIHFYKKYGGIDVKDVFMKEGGNYIPTKFKQKNIIDYRLKNIINNVSLVIRRWIYNNY